jgi:hypothetical protein
MKKVYVLYMHHDTTKSDTFLAKTSMVTMTPDATTISFTEGKHWTITPGGTVTLELVHSVTYRNAVRVIVYEMDE